MINRVVVGVDSTDSARDAIVLGAAVGKAMGAAVTLVGVHSTSLFPVPQMSDRRTLRRHAEQTVRHDRERFAPDASIHIAVDYSVPRALRHYAQRTGADLVVVGSAGKAQKGRVAIGRTGRQLLESAPFSVAVAPRGLHASSLTLGTIGVGLDKSSESHAALEFATALAGGADATLRVLSVIEDHVPALSSAWIAKNRKHDLEDLRDAALSEARQRLASVTVKAEVDAQIGDAGKLLRELTTAVDLIVVGSRRWGPVARLVSGGVGESLVADSSCSVLLVPRPRGAASKKKR